MRGLLELGAPRRVFAGVSLAMFVVFLSIPALAAGPSWKGAVAEIERIQDEAIWAFNELVTEFEQFLLTDPTAQEAEDELAQVESNIRKENREAKRSVRRILREYPDSPQVQKAGTAALETITAGKDFTLELVSFRYDEYVAGLSDPPMSTTTTTVPPTSSTTSSTTTTTLPPATTTSTTPTTTTTTAVPPTSSTTSTLPPTSSTTSSTTTTTLAPVTTTITSPPPTLSDRTTTTVPATTSTTETTTAPPVATNPSTTTAPAPPATSTTTVAAAGSPASPTTSTSVPGSASSSRRASSASGLSAYAVEPPPLARATPSSDMVDEGLAASFSRVLEPVLPTPLADVVASPLLLLEILWRAVSSSGRGLVMPVALLVFSVVSLLWDRRLSKAGPARPAS